MTQGPDFLCIGMQKAGTGWLFDQLQHHPDFWMPPVKELHYFDRPFPHPRLAKNIEQSRSAPEALEKKRKRLNWRPLDKRDREFFAAAAQCKDHPGDLGHYVSLFRFKDGLKSGDITPAYSTLPDGTIEKIANSLPHVQIILLLRDPVARVWSQISMAYRQDQLDASLLDEPARLRQFLGSAKVQRRSFPSEIFRRWRRHVPEERMRHFFFDDIETDPARVRGEVLEFLGADPGKPSGTLEPQYNRKSGQKKLELTAPVRSMLVEHFAEEIRECARLFGGPARNWAARLG